MFIKSIGLLSFTLVVLIGCASTSVMKEETSPASSVTPTLISEETPNEADEFPTKIEKLIKQLGSDDWQTREKATEDLSKLIELDRCSAIPLLKKNSRPTY